MKDAKMHGSRLPDNAAAPAADTTGDRPAWRRLLARVAREPLTHFAALGLLIFAAAHYLEMRSQRYAIDLGPAQQRRIAASYAQQYGAPPSPAEMKAMTDDYVRQEILLREGLALGLDKDDEIVRRRIAQKFEFLLQDRTTGREPSEADLKAWFAGHSAKYAVAPRRTFDQLYFAIDERGEDAARRLAQTAVAALRGGSPAPAADTFPGPPVVRLLSQGDTDRLFGGEGFAAKLFAAPQGEWSGPYRSAFGWHVIRVTEDQAARRSDFAASRAAVLNDWKEAERAAHNKATFDEIRARYSITSEGAAR